MHTPEQLGAPSRSASTQSRRRFVTRAGIGALALSFLPTSSRAMSNLVLGEYRPKGSTDDAVPDLYEGPLYGHEVTWDTDIWAYSLSADEGSDYAYDFVSLSGVATSALSNVVHQEVPFEDVETAVDEALPHYLSQYGSTLDDVEVIDSWDSDEAAGFLWYWTGYDDIPYTYVEYSLTDETGIWCVSYIQFRGSSWSDQGVTDLLSGIDVDGEPLVRAADVEDIVNAIADEIG